MSKAVLGQVAQLPNTIQTTVKLVVAKKETIEYSDEK
jgi:hypothetical protein